MPVLPDESGEYREFFPDAGRPRLDGGGEIMRELWGNVEVNEGTGNGIFHENNGHQTGTKSRKGTSEPLEVVENKRRGRGGTGRRTSLRAETSTLASLIP